MFLAQGNNGSLWSVNSRLTNYESGALPTAPLRSRAVRWKLSSLYQRYMCKQSTIKQRTHSHILNYKEEYNNTNNINVNILYHVIGPVVEGRW